MEPLSESMMTRLQKGDSHGRGSNKILSSFYLIDFIINEL